VHLIAGNDTDNKVKEIYCDRKGYMTIRSDGHDRVHRGVQWVVNRLNVANPDDGFIWVRVQTGAKPCHIEISFTNGGDATFNTWAGTTNYATQGNTADGVNMTLFNRSSAVAKALLSTIRFDPTFTVANAPNGTLRGLRGIPGGSGGTATGSTGGKGELESVIPPNSDFLCALKNISGQSRLSEIVIELYEEDSNE
jgi:hypothetical protein